MESVDLEKFSVDSDLQSIADAMTVAGLNFCGGVFDHLETGEEFELTISKCSGVRDLKSNHDRLVEELSDIACESLFGESIQNCRPDVAATVRCMIEGGYRNDKITNEKSTLY